MRICRAALVAVAILAPGPWAHADEVAADARPRRLIVVLGAVPDVAAVARHHARGLGIDVTHVYTHALKGYSAVVAADDVPALLRDPRVVLVEPDRPVATAVQQVPTGIRRAAATANPTMAIDGVDHPRVDVDIAVLDTGVDPMHTDLNVVATTNCTGTFGSSELCVDGAGGDENGHGTHVAGIAAALDNGEGVVGVAPGARVHSVKVLGASGHGLLSWIIAGVDWVTARSDTIEVANMSLTCECSSVAFNQALAASTDRGIVHVVAAGNNDRDAKDFSPAHHPDVITVSALADFNGAPGGGSTPTCRPDEDDTLADFSNWGPLVEVAAPGTCILSTMPFGRYDFMSGTSMASPHVAGAAAVLTSGANDPYSRSDVASVRDKIVATGDLEWHDDSGDGVKEPLLAVGNGQVFTVNSSTRTIGGGSVNESPIATFTSSCSGSTCTFDASDSYDVDGSISSYAWDFGDGTTGAGMTQSKTYGASAGYVVTLTVTDDRGAQATTSRTVTVTRADEPIYLTGGGVMIRGSATVRLQWAGTDLAGSIVVYRNGREVAIAPDQGSYIDSFAATSGTYTYRVCEPEAGAACSNEVTLSF